MKTLPAEKQVKTNKIVAIGDLHGDFYRLTRILTEQEIIISDTLAWNPAADNVDLVLIGDYIDWRGEELEGDPDYWALGPQRILKFIFSLYKQVKNLKAEKPGFNSNFYPLLGNHDLMMLDGLKIFTLITPQELRAQLADPKFYRSPLSLIIDNNLDKAGQQIYTAFLNWYTQGGDVTINSFGGLEPWKRAMEGELGEFLQNKLRLGILIGDTFFAHTLPDSREFYRPLEELLALPPEERSQAMEEYLWGRSVWGYDYYSGQRTKPPSEKEFAGLLARIGAKIAVVGHTPIKGQEPFSALGGKLINIDQHGIPGSAPWIKIVSEE